MPVKRKLAKNKSKGRAYGTAGIQQSSRRTRRTMAKEINAGLQIVYRKLSEMHPNPKNPRKSTKEAIERLAASIKGNPNFFEARPILLSDRTGEFVIIGGERRSEAASLLKMEEVPTILLSGLTEAEEDEILIKDNTHAGVWDEQKLQAWGKDKLQSWDVDGVKWPKKELQVKEDDFNPEKKVKSRVKPGELWQLGRHRLMCGDSTKIECFDTLMGGALADMVFTDPPYGVSIGDKNQVLQSVQQAERIVENIQNDTLSVSELYKVLKAAMTNVRLHCKDDAAYFVTAPQGGGLGLMMMMMMKDAGLEVRHNLIWRKNAPTFSLGRLDYDYQHEPIMYTWTKSHHNYRGGQFRSTIWDFEKPRKCDLHPTMKPVGLIVNCLMDCTKEDDIVLDAFGGSGTTIIAAEQTQRICYMMEIDTHYCDVIIDRWEQFSGKKAEKIQ